MSLIRLNTRSLPDSAVTTAKVADNAVTTAKVNADAITNAKIADDAIQTENVNSGVNLGRRNILINGAMQIYQRGSTTFAHDGTTSGYSLDRFNMALGGTHEQLDGTLAQVADHPTSANGKSLKWTTGTPETSYDADEYIYLTQKIEAQNVQHLNYSNSGAKTITVSFYVKSSITGTYALGLYKPDNVARIFNKTYTISSANTWEKKTVTFVGDVSGTSINNDNGQGLWVTWHLAAGANAKGASSSSGWVNYAGLSNWADGQGTNAVMTTASATWQMTECQVEVGDTETDFEHRSFAEELILCQRYYYRRTVSTGYVEYMPYAIAYATTDIQGGAFHPVKMRASPTLAFSGVLKISQGNAVVTSSSLNFTSTSTPDTMVFYTHSSAFSGLTQFRGYSVYGNANDYMEVNSEL